MPTLKEMAVKTAVEMGYPEDTGEHNRYVNRYLQGAKAALEMAQHTLPPTNQRFSGYDICQRIRALTATGR